MTTTTTTTATTTDVAVPEPAGEVTPFQASWDAQLVAERKLTRGLFKFVLLATPFFWMLFIGLLAIAIGDQEDWYVFVALGLGMGTLAACLFGLLAGVTLNAEVLEDVEHEYNRKKA
jgi:hypothetical protein